MDLFFLCMLRERGISQDAEAKISEANAVSELARKKHFYFLLSFCQSWGLNSGPEHCPRVFSSLALCHLSHSATSRFSIYVVLSNQTQIFMDVRQALYHYAKLS